MECSECGSQLPIKGDPWAQGPHRYDECEFCQGTGVMVVKGWPSPWFDPSRIMRDGKLSKLPGGAYKP